MGSVTSLGPEETGQEEETGSQRQLGSGMRSLDSDTANPQQPHSDGAGDNPLGLVLSLSGFLPALSIGSAHPEPPGHAQATPDTGRAGRRPEHRAQWTKVGREDTQHRSSDPKLHVFATVPTAVPHPGGRRAKGLPGTMAHGDPPLSAASAEYRQSHDAQSTDPSPRVPLGRRRQLSTRRDLRRRIAAPRVDIQWDQPGRRGRHPQPGVSQAPQRRRCPD